LESLNESDLSEDTGGKWEDNIKMDLREIVWQGVE
jgi:hypothetical protein